MDKLIAEVRELLRGRTLVELRIIRGMVLRLRYPPRRQLALTESQLTTEQLIPRQFFEVDRNEVKPLMIGDRRRRERA